MAERKKVGVALSGGAARGAAHLGVLQVLEREGIPIDVVAGVSAGSVVGALYCAGMPLEKMVELMDGMSWWRIARPTIPWHGLLSFKRLEDLIISWIGDVWFGDLKRPFAVGTTDLLTGYPVVFTSGRVAPIVRASCSIPGLVTPLEYGEYWLVDGGASCNLPARAARDLGADVVIGVDLLKSYTRKSFGFIGIAMTALEILVRHSGGGLEESDIVISPALDNATYSRFSKRREMMALGEEAAVRALPLIRALISDESGGAQVEGRGKGDAKAALAPVSGAP